MRDNKSSLDDVASDGGWGSGCVGEAHPILIFEILLPQEEDLIQICQNLSQHLTYSWLLGVRVTVPLSASLWLCSLLLYSGPPSPLLPFCRTGSLPYWRLTGVHLIFLIHLSSRPRTTAQLQDEQVGSFLLW